MLESIALNKSQSAGWKKVVRKETKIIKPYIPGKPIEEVKEEYGLEKVIKLASNENPLGVSPLVEKTIKEEISNINRYPDGGSSTLKRDLAEKMDVDEDMLTIGNGSDGLLKVIAEAFLESNSRVIISYPSFVEYKFVSQLMGCQIVRVWMRDYRQNLQGILDAVTSDTKMIFLTNPDNPTGTMLPDKEIRKLLDRLPDDIIVVLDEAYHEYVQGPDYPDGINYIKEGYPVIILRTFSKVYGLAGLRLGYAVSCAGIREVLMKVRDPFNVNHIAEKAGKAALADEEFVQRTIAVNEEGKEYLYGELDRMGLYYVPTQANFLLIKVDMDSDILFKKLLKRGIIIRSGKPLSFPGHIRVSIGLPEENREFIRNLELTLE